MFLCSHLCMYVCHYLFTCILKQLSWTGWPKVLDYAILAGAVIEPAPYPEVGLLTSSSSYCSFCFLFSPFVAFRWLRESPPALGFGHFSIAICQFPMHSQRISLQLKFCTFTLTPLPLFPLPSSVSLAARASSSPPRQTTAGAMEQQSSEEQPHVDVEDVSEVSVLPTQITSIDGFFNRKRGRPPKNRFVEVYKSVSRAKKFKFSSQIFRLLNR